MTADTLTIPTLGRGHKFRFDQVRNAWVILGPERMIDGTRSIDAIAADLAARFDASMEDIRADVQAMLADLSARGAVRL
jgi:pyrroloquinoline quinone biosynthesis protein D